VEPAASVTLPGGLWLDDRHLREAGLSPLTGYDEAYLLSLRTSLPPARWASELLSRCLTHLGEVNPVPLEYVQALTVGDREALLLHLRHLSFGERLRCIFHCPRCDAKLDFDLDIDRLLLPPYESESLGYWFRVPLPERKLIVTFRLPVGGDQEAVADLAAHDPQAAAIALLVRCLHSVRQDNVELDPVPEELLSWLVDPLAALMSERDPQAELLIDNRCPVCEHRFDVLLDMTRFLADEINQRIRYLYREVHLLAWYYHWSEADIMQMTRPHRQIYLDLLDETLREAPA
jgi:hypothetical protein